METTSHVKQSHLLLGILVAFTVGYFLYPQINTTKIKEGTHQMPDGSMMANEVSHSNMTARQMMDDMNSKLIGKTGGDFDATFLEQMIPHHQGAVSMANLVLSTSTRPELIKLANEIIASQQKEIELMREWQKAWFGIKAQ